MEQLTLDFFKSTAVLAGLVIGLSQILKPLLTGKLERFTPLLPVVLGIALSFLTFGGFSTLALLVGLMVGLSAAGLYDQHKVVTG